MILTCWFFIFAC